MVPSRVDGVRCRDYCRVITDSIVLHMNETPFNRSRFLVEMLSVRGGCGSPRRSPKGVPSPRFDVLYYTPRFASFFRNDELTHGRLAGDSKQRMRFDVYVRGNCTAG